MGSERFGPPEALVAVLQKSFDISCFFETGTFQGDTAGWAARRFDRVYTVERSPEFHEFAKARFAGEPHVRTLLGDSRQHLTELTAILPPTIFWLDAHWMGGSSAGAQDECPLLDELGVVAPALDRHVVLIDDARLFMAPPPPPHNPAFWPTLCATTDALRTHHEPYICIYQDVIVAVPARGRAQLVAFLRGESTLTALQ